MSGRSGEPRELVILNRRVQWTDDGLRMAPDDRHLKDLIDELGLGGASHVDTPMPVTQRNMDEEELKTLDAADSTLYRRLAAKLNYLSMDRPDVRHAASVICSTAASPRVGDMVRLKRVVRFMKGRPVMWTYFRWGLVWKEIKAFTDSDWALSREDRRSMSGGMLVHNGSLLRFWSRKQKAISLSSWESELYAGVTAVVEAMGLQSGLADLGCQRSVVLLSDNQGVVDHTARQGLGLAKHVHIRNLWLQAARDEGQLDVRKVHTSQNPADVLTKALPFARVRALCRLVGAIYDGNELDSAEGAC